MSQAVLIGHIVIIPSCPWGLSAVLGGPLPPWQSQGSNYPHCKEGFQFDDNSSYCDFWPTQRPQYFLRMLGLCTVSSVIHLSSSGFSTLVFSHLLVHVSANQNVRALSNPMDYSAASRLRGHVSVSPTWANSTLLPSLSHILMSAPHIVSGFLSA
jgi:hypothetical protein